VFVVGFWEFFLKVFCDFLTIFFIKQNLEAIIVNTTHKNSQKSKNPIKPKKTAEILKKPAKNSRKPSKKFYKNLLQQLTTPLHEINRHFLSFHLNTVLL
jgi:hypothetical protein